MKHGIAWLVGSVVLVPALFAWGAGGIGGVSSERQITPAEINAYIAWTPDQREKILPLLQARAAQAKSIQEQIRQLQEQMKPLLAQMREINDQFEQNLTALSTSDQVAEAKERIANSGWESSNPAGEAARHHEWASSRPANETVSRHEWASSRPANDIARHHEWSSSRPAGQETHGHAWASSRPAGEIAANRRQKLEREREHLQREIKHVNHELKEQH